MNNFIKNTNECFLIVADYIIKLQKNKDLDNNEYKILLENTYALLNDCEENDEYYNIGLSAICHVSEKLPQDTLVKQLLLDCIVSSRVFLYRQMLLDRNVNLIEESYIDLFAKSYYTQPTGTILTKDQKQLLKLFQQHKRLIVSAPTSFGKTRIIEEIILQNKYKNIAIVLPTIALLSETYVKFVQNRKISDKYSLINSLVLADTSLNRQYNIFILTPERMDLLLDKKPTLHFDFFVMDEIYKIQDDLERNQIFTNCLYRLSKHKCDFYLIGPYFNDFSPKFREMTNSIFKKFTAEIVQKNVFEFNKVENGDKYSINGKQLKKLKDPGSNLEKIIEAIDGQSLIYVGNRRSVETKAKAIADIQITTKNSELIEYIKETIAENWGLVKCLERGVAFHHSSVPKYIQTEIVDSFNNDDGYVNIIVCTTTLTEGVNTSAKNVLIFDNKKGFDNEKKISIPLTGFDVKNIKGRAGRFLSHFIGNVIYFNDLPESNKGTIEFSYFDNINLSDEESIQAEKQDLFGQNLDKRNEIENKLKQRQIPLELIQKNKFIPITKQLKLIEYLRNNPNILRTLFFNSNLPSKNKLINIINLCHNFLFNSKDSNDRNFSINNLIRLTNYYIYKRPNLKQLIAAQGWGHYELSEDKIKKINLDNVSEEVCGKMHPLINHKFYKRSVFLSNIEEYIGTTDMMNYQKVFLKYSKSNKEIDTKIRQAFKLITHYFEFALPKYLTAFENIYNFVYNELRIPKYYQPSLFDEIERNVPQEFSLKYTITLLEFGFVYPHEIALREAGIPNGIVNKIADKFIDCITLEDIRVKYRHNPKLIRDLKSFEQKIFNKYI